MTKSRIKIFLLTGLLGCLSACQAEPMVELNGQRFSVEIADDTDEQARGLMFREQMDVDHGMLFIFNGMAPRAFWMKNTRIALDIFYFDQELKLVSVAENVRPCKTQRCPNYPSEGPAKYVLELNAGLAGKLGSSKGDELSLINIDD